MEKRRIPFREMPVCIVCCSECVQDCNGRNGKHAEACIEDHRDGCASCRGLC